MESLKSEIKKLSSQLNLQKIGFTRADNFEYFHVSLIEQKEAGHTLGFEHKNIDGLLHPKLAGKKSFAT